MGCRGSYWRLVPVYCGRPADEARRMKKKAQREAEARAKELADIYGRVACTRVRLGGLERATRILEEARKKDDVPK